MSYTDIMRTMKKEKGLRHIRSQAPEWMQRRAATLLQNRKAMETGRCGVCGRDYKHKYEGLLFVEFKTCLPCAQRIASIQVGRIKKREFNFNHFYCDLCLRKTVPEFTINAPVCSRCIESMGHLHKHRMPSINKERIRRVMKGRQRMME